MRVRHQDLKADELESPKGKFGIVFREHARCEASGCPFDLEHVHQQAGQAQFPLPRPRLDVGALHVLSGAATMRTGEETVEARARRQLSVPTQPGASDHQRVRSGFHHLIIANDPPHDNC
ncbi:MAG: hypothetical protein VX733_11050 [Candidatus Latescibacterota bacterium]|nr:hypothetical protein [Candidatus Latescibacterota bacterium]